MADIARKGIREPLVVVEREGEYLVVDGLHRLRAAKELGLKRVPVSLRGMTDEEVLDYVLSSAVCRRSLTHDQRAALAARLLPENPVSVEIRDLAVRFGTTPNLIKKALVLRERSEELFEKVLCGLINIAAAFDILNLPAERTLHPRVEKADLPGEVKEKLSILPPDLQVFVARELEILFERPPVVIGPSPKAEELSLLLREVEDLLSREKNLRERTRKERIERRKLEGLLRRLYVVLENVATREFAKAAGGKGAGPRMGTEAAIGGLEKSKKILENIGNLKEASSEPEEEPEDPEFREGALRLERALQYILLGFSEKSINEVLLALRKGYLSREAERVLFALLDRMEEFTRAIRHIAISHVGSGTRKGKGRRFLVIRKEEKGEAEGETSSSR